MIKLKPGSVIVSEGDSLTFGYDEVEGDEFAPLHRLPFKTQRFALSRNSGKAARA